ncbi:MAG: PQQ-dependent sugar dehydrogenase [Verrucomicrobiales bacterium]|nr:PQQ-dependent sugar dehydrogenase [Verrucomicrobiales bacterium]
MSYRHRLLAVAFVTAILTSFTAAQAEVNLPPGFALEVVAGPDLVSEPMDLNFAPDGSAWVTGRAGELWRIDTTARTAHQVGRVSTDVSGDRGLHGVAFHPDFPKTPHLFLSYHTTNHSPTQYRARVARWTVVGKGAKSALEPASEKSILEWDGDSAGQHVGGGLLAHPQERLLYVTTGENNQNANLRKYCDDPENRAQSLSDRRGKVVRIGFDGSIPSDNPFVKTAGADGIIFTRGHRQPWSLDYDAPTGLILLSENGGDLADDYDEVNRIVPGANYGWPKVFGDGWSTFSRTNRFEGFTSPWFSYKRNSSASCVGSIIYRPSSTGAGFPAKYHGSLFYADFARKSVRSAPVNAETGKPGESAAFLQGLTAGPLALRLGPDGALYLATHGGASKPSTNDSIVRVVWKK